MLASAIEVYEVYRVLRRTFTVQQATDMVTALRRARIVSVDEPLAMSATEVALAHGLAMADSIIYATARDAGQPSRGITFSPKRRMDLSTRSWGTPPRENEPMK